MKEEDIRPRGILDTFLDLANQDIPRFFTSQDREEIPCPACGGAGSPAFTKQGFGYEECAACRTLFVSPRPSAAEFQDYYQHSESAAYWASTFYRETSEARREKLWKPKARQVQEVLVGMGCAEAAVVDIGGGYGIFAEEYRLLTGREVTVIEPSRLLAGACREKHLHVVEEFLEKVRDSQLPEGKRAFVSFELFEHLHDPRVFCRQVFGLMKPGDTFLFTTLSGTGLDIRELWENSAAVSPPHHLNFFNPRSIRRFLEDVGFRVHSVTTPGKLDLDILRNNLARVRDPFWRLFLEEGRAADFAAMQNVLSQSLFSSHMMTVCVHP
ncbi:MAG: class I SAM-dependent methyltransferase [Chthoniobacterales bacterium]|nr:class I SAM-dependent methyltransferase [Chthoniobacterales bacterium]